MLAVGMTAKTAVALRTVVVLRTRSMMAVVAVWKGVARFVVRSRTVKPSGWWRVMVVMVLFPFGLSGESPPIAALWAGKLPVHSAVERYGLEALDYAA